MYRCNLFIKKSTVNALNGNPGENNSTGYSGTGANLDVMDQDAKRMRGEKPFLFSNMKTKDGLESIISFIEKQGLFKA